MNNETPLLNAQEHAELEHFIGRKLTNDQAQMLLKDAILEAAFNVWAERKETWKESVKDAVEAKR